MGLFVASATPLSFVFCEVDYVFRVAFPMVWVDKVVVGMFAVGNFVN